LFGTCATPGRCLADLVNQLNGEYTIQASAVQLAPYSWRFTYEVTNINQDIGAYTGLDVLGISVPSSAIISNVTLPDPYYGPPGYWSTYQDGSFFEMWGYDPQSAYPIGPTARFSFQADGVSAGNTEGFLRTFWGEGPVPPQWTYFVTQYGHYSDFATILEGPVAVPEPSTLSMVGSAAFCALVWAWRRRRMSPIGT